MILRVLDIAESKIHTGKALADEDIIPTILRKRWTPLPTILFACTEQSVELVLNMCRKGDITHPPAIKRANNHVNSQKGICDLAQD